MRAEQRYTERHGDHYAAGITYFSVLALVPLIMVAFAVLALVLLANPELLARLKDSVGNQSDPRLTCGVSVLASGV